MNLNRFTEKAQEAVLAAQQLAERSRHHTLSQSICCSFSLNNPKAWYRPYSDSSEAIRPHLFKKDVSG